MKSKLLKGFLGSAALIALSLNNVNAADAQSDAGSSFAGLNFGVGYGFDIATTTKDNPAGLEIAQDHLFGKEAKVDAKSTKYANLAGGKSDLKAVSFENAGTEWETYAEEMLGQPDKKDEKGQAGGLIEDNKFSMGVPFKEIGDDDKNAMSHYGWMSVGYGFNFGDVVVEPQLTLKIKGSTDKRKVKSESTIYSTYLGDGSQFDGDDIVELDSDNEGNVVEIAAATATAAATGDIMVKIGTGKIAKGLLVSGDGSAVDKGGWKANVTLPVKNFYQLAGDQTAHGAVTIGGKTLTEETGAAGPTDINIRKALGLEYGATGTYLNQTVYAKREIKSELKNNFEAALHANVGYAFNQYFMAYAKLGMSLDFYKLDLKRETVGFDADMGDYNLSAFEYDVSNLKLENVYAKFAKENDAHSSGGKLLADQDADFYIKVSGAKRSGGDKVSDDGKDFEFSDTKLDALKATDGLTAEATDVKATKEKNTFVQLNADFGLGLAANVWKGMQLRAEFVYSLPLNKEKKMYDDNVTLTMKPHKFKFNFGVVVPLSMITG